MCFCFLRLTESRDCEEQYFAPRNEINAMMILRSNQYDQRDLFFLAQPHILVRENFLFAAAVTFGC